MKLVTPLTEEQQAVITLLEEALREAKAGHINSIGIIACMPTGFASVMAGKQAGDLYLGAGDMQRKILDAVTGGNRAKAPSIVLARPMQS